MPKAPPRPNRETIRLLEQWASQPPLHDDPFWDKFESELRENRMTLRARP